MDKDPKDIDYQFALLHLRLRRYNLLKAALVLIALPWLGLLTIEISLGLLLLYSFYFAFRAKQFRYCYHINIQNKEICFYSINLFGDKSSFVLNQTKKNNIRLLNEGKKILLPIPNQPVLTLIGFFVGDFARDELGKKE